MKPHYNEQIFPVLLLVLRYIDIPLGDNALKETIGIKISHVLITLKMAVFAKFLALPMFLI